MLYNGFGALHLAKAFVNSIRNHVVQHNGEYFGTDILIALRNECASLQNIKNAVFVGKDRQSDLLSWLTVCSDVQEALSLQEFYCMQRLPEKFLPYKKKALSQKKVIYAVDVCSNANGDVFILDAGAACVHVVDRSTVAYVTQIGHYNTPNLEKYSKDSGNSVKKIRFSNSLMDISIDNDANICVTDRGRKEIVLIRGCVQCRQKR